MRSELIVLVGVLSGVGLAREVVTASIDCSSGKPDLNSGVTSVSADECHTQCRANCADSVRSTDDLERCLTNDALKGCLFQVNTAREHDVKYCVRSPEPEATVGDELVVQISGDDLYVTGQTATAVPDEKMSVSEVTLVVDLKESAKLRSCANRTVKVGVSSLPFNAESCAVEGSLAIDKSFTVSSDGENLVVPVGDALKGLWGQKENVVVVVQLQDPVCGPLSVDDVEAYFAVTYQAGYVDTSVCGDISNCLQCQVANCHWCSWDSAVDKMLPDWLPDWDWVNSAKSQEVGKCGLNSAICRLSAGQYNVCAAFPTFSAAAFVLAAAVFARI